MPALSALSACWVSGCSRSLLPPQEPPTASRAPQQTGLQAGSTPCETRWTSFSQSALRLMPAACSRPRRRSESCQPPVEWCERTLWPRTGPVSLSLWAILVAKFGLLFANDRPLPAFGVEYLLAASAAAMPQWPRYPYVAVLSIGRALLVLEARRRSATTAASVGGQAARGNGT